MGDQRHQADRGTRHRWTFQRRRISVGADVRGETPVPCLLLDEEAQPGRARHLASRNTGRRGATAGRAPQEEERNLVTVVSFMDKLQDLHPQRSGGGSISDRGPSPSTGGRSAPSSRLLGRNWHSQPRGRAQLQIRVQRLSAARRRSTDRLRRPKPLACGSTRLWDEIAAGTRRWALRESDQPAEHWTSRCGSVTQASDDLVIYLQAGAGAQAERRHGRGRTAAV